MKTHTPAEIAAILLAGMESTLPDRMLEALKPFDGKPITTRILAKMPREKEWRLRRAYGMTHLDTTDAHSVYGPEGGVSMLLCHSEASIPLDLAKMVELNGCYYSARVYRNSRRQEALDSPHKLQEIADVLNRVEMAIYTLQSVTAELETHIGYGGLFNADSTAIETLCGLRTVKGGHPLINAMYRRGD